MSGLPTRDGETTAVHEVAEVDVQGVLSKPKSTDLEVLAVNHQNSADGHEGLVVDVQTSKLHESSLDRGRKGQFQH